MKLLNNQQKLQILENLNLQPIENYLTKITGVQVILKKIFTNVSDRPSMELFMENIPNDKLGCFAKCYNQTDIGTFGSARFIDSDETTQLIIPAFYIFYKLHNGGINEAGLCEVRYDLDSKSYTANTLEDNSVREEI